MDLTYYFKRHTVSRVVRYSRAESISSRLSTIAEMHCPAPALWHGKASSTGLSPLQLPSFQEPQPHDARPRLESTTAIRCLAIAPSIRADGHWNCRLNRHIPNPNNPPPSKSIVPIGFHRTSRPAPFSITPYVMSM